jgi:formylglycine-generating enzyme required for sulfatase activity
MGTNSEQAWPGDGEGPVRAVRVSPFYIDICAVTTRILRSLSPLQAT